MGLHQELQRLASQHPETRAHLVPLLRKYACGDEMLAEGDELMGGRTWGNPDPHSTPDDSSPYNRHENSPPAGADGSAQRKKYNDWFRKNVCPNHKTNCGAPWLKAGAEVPLAKQAIEGPGGSDMEDVRDALIKGLKAKGIKATDSVSANAFHIGDDKYAIHGSEWLEGPGLGARGLRIQEKDQAKWVAAAVAAIAKAQK